MAGAFLAEVVVVEGVVVAGVLLAAEVAVGGGTGNEVEIALRDACPPRSAVSI